MKLVWNSSQLQRERETVALFQRRKWRDVDDERDRMIRIEKKRKRKKKERKKDDFTGQVP